MNEKICNVSFEVDPHAAQVILERIRSSSPDDKRSDNEILKSILAEFVMNQSRLAKNLLSISVIG